MTVQKDERYQRANAGLWRQARANLLASLIAAFGEKAGRELFESLRDPEFECA